MQTKELANVRLQFARWEDLPPGVQDQFAGFVGGDRNQGQAFYQLYFYWYNIAHEAGHVLRAVYQAATDQIWKEETSANQFAIAYWRAKGQTRLLLELENEIRYVLTVLPDPVPAHEDREAYLNKHYQELGADPAAYGHYQFSMVRSGLEHPLEFSQALHTLISSAANDGNTIPLSPDLPLDEQMPFRILEDMRKTLSAYDLRLPEIQVTCAYAPPLQFVTWETQD